MTGKADAVREVTKQFKDRMSAVLSDGSYVRTPVEP